MGSVFSTVGARVISLAVNFLTNRRFVFDSRAGMMRTFVRYVCLAVPIMLASWLIIYMLSNIGEAGIDHLGRTILKAPVDIVLFLVSFRVQRKWVFTENRKSL